MADLPGASDLLGDRPEEGPPGVADLLGERPTPPPYGFHAGQRLWTGPESDALTSAYEPIGRVLRSFGQGAETAWDHGENLGYSDDVNDALKKAGVYPDVTKGQGGVMRAFNEGLIRPSVNLLFGGIGALGRGISAAVSGGQGAAAQAGEEVGAPMLGRDIAALPEAFPLFGAETGGLHGVPTLPRAQALGQELARPLAAAEVDRAADLGIIGPTARSSWQDTGYGAPVTATQDSITPTVTARVSSLQDVAKQDAAAGAPPPTDAPLAPTDIHTAARNVDPETFAAYDPLVQRVDTLRDQIAAAQEELRQNAAAQAPHQAEIADLQERLQDTTPRLEKKYQARLEALIPERDAFLADDDKMALLTRDTPEIQAMREQLQQTDYQMRDLAPQVTAAYREAAKQFPESQAEPVAAPAEPAAPVAAEPTPPERLATVPAATEPTPAPPLPLAVAAESAAATRPEITPTVKADVPPIDIREDVAAKLQAAGRPADEATAAAELVAAGYETRAARFQGAKGTAADLYRDEAPDIAAGRASATRARVPEMAQRQTTRGKINIDDGHSVITLMKDANASTFIHETGHDWLEKLMGDARDSRAPAGLAADGKTVRDWLGAGPDGAITTAQHEKFARGFERYMMEGTAPSRGLAGVFAQFKGWLTGIYQTVAKLRAPITDDIRQVFDRMLATPDEAAVIAPERAAAANARELTGHPESLTPYLTPGKEPTRLLGFLRRKTVQFPGSVNETTIPGGLRDPGGDISAIIGGPKGLPGLINNATGSSINDARIRAWEHGYFPEHTSTHTMEDNDLLRKIEEDHRGNPQYSIHDQDLVDAYHGALAHNAEVDRLAAEHGIDTMGKTRDQFFDEVAEKASLEEQNDSIRNAEGSRQSTFDEATAETKSWLEDHDIPWNSDAFYGLDGPRTLDELEAERGQEASAGREGQGEADDAHAATAAGDPGQGEAVGGPRGRGIGPAGRAEAEATEGPGPGQAGKPDARPEQPNSPHAAVTDPSDLVDKAGNIRLDNLNSGDDVKQVLRDLAAQNDDFMAARGGVISDVQRRAMADALGLDPATFTAEKPLGVSPSVWAEAVQKLTFQASDEAARIGRMAGESGSPADLAAYLASKQRLLMIADHFSTLTAEAGRTLRVFDKKGFAFTGDMVATMERDTGKTLYQMQQEAKAVGALETTAQRSKMMQDMREPTRAQTIKSGIVSYFINNLISGPVTHAAYSVGNTVTALFKAIPLTLAEASIDTVRQALSDAPLADRVRFGEVGAQVYGAMHGAWAGFSPGWKAFKSGISYMEGADRIAANLAEHRAGGQAMLPGTSPLGEAALRPAVIGPGLEAAGVPGAIARPVGYVLETPSRAVSAIHTVFYSMNYEREIARRAFRAASNEGLTGDAFNTRVAELTQDPPLGMVQAAHDEAMSSVLMQKPAYGGNQQKVVAIVNGILPLKLAMPFMQVGMNILDEGLIKNTPLGLASQTVRDNLFGRNGEVARTQQYARIGVGSGIVAGVMAAAADGIITGSGPSDPRERALKEATGWKADSIRIGDTYVPIRKYLGPLGVLVSGAASIYDVGHLLNQGQVTKAAGAAILGFAHVVADETWMAGLSSLVDAVTHWDTDGEKYLRNMALSFMPFSVGTSQVARMTDQYQREVHSWTAAAANKLPGLSESLMPQRDWTGTPVGSHTMMSPSVFKNDRTMAAMESAEFFPAKIRRDVRGVPLTDQQYDDLSRVAGNLAKRRMDMLTQTPGFQQLPEGLQREQMQQTLASSRKTGEDWLMLQPGNENIMRQATDAKAAKMQGKLPEDVKAIRQGAPP